MSYFYPKPTTRNLAGIIAALTTLPALAAAPMEEVTVTASRTPIPLERVGSSVGVLTTEDLEKKGDPVLADILRTLPGISVSNSGGVGKDTAVRIRGEAAHRTQLYIDGIDVADTTGPQIYPKFENLLSTQIERVEVLRGPQGMMYGSDAGGVVNVLSKVAQKSFEGDEAIEVGTENTQLLSGNVRGKTSTIDYSLSASGFETQGFNARTDDPTHDKDGFSNIYSHNKLSAHLNNNTSIGLVYRHVDADNLYDGCGYPTVNNCENKHTNDAAKLDVSYQTDSQSHQLAFTENSTENSQYLTGNPSATWRIQGASRSWQYNGHTAFTPAVATSYGLEAKDENFEDKTYGSRHARRQYGLYAEGQFQIIENLFYTAGARTDDNEDFGTHNSVRSGAAYLIPLSQGKLKIKSTYSTGYRAPSLYEIYNNQTPESIKNGAAQNLKTEASEGKDFGIEWISERATVGLTAFHTLLTNEIYYQYPAGYLQSSGSSHAQGMEFESQYEISNQITVGANYTLTDTSNNQDATSGRARIPHNQYNLHVDFSGLEGKLAATVFYRHQGASTDIDNIRLGNYEVLDANVTWHFNSEMETYIRLTNALNEQYQEVHWYQSSPRSGSAGLRYKF